MVCPWPFLASIDSTTTQTPETGKTFAQVLADSGYTQLSQLPTKVVRGDTVRVKISQDEYEHGIEDCKQNLHARLTLNKRSTFNNASPEAEAHWIVAKSTKLDCDPFRERFF